uniref:EOG090X04Z9 n=1 Tax=Alona affinis TaxID=381656 RepID=A0A9N6ZES4_9CRUS|nr:EOG090X04Z9 [Alona affinis]
MVFDGQQSGNENWWAKEFSSPLNTFNTYQENRTAAPPIRLNNAALVSHQFNNNSNGPICWTTITFLSPLWRSSPDRPVMSSTPSEKNSVNNEDEEIPSKSVETTPVAIPSSAQSKNSSFEDDQTGTSSASGDLGGSSKRQKIVTSPETASSSSMFSMVSASPPGFVTLEEIMKAANSVSKMALAHEIAVDEDFTLEKVDPPSNSIQKKIKDIAHQAFWDLFKEELEQDPPNYSRGLILLEEIREWLLSLLLPHQTKTIQEIRNKIDLDLIRQQITAGVLDMHSYSHYIISLMGRLCSPARDEKIRELTALRDPVLLYKGIFETLELMRIDMANFTIRMSRPHIAAHSVEYERVKFEEYLKITPDGMRNTRLWLVRNSKNVLQRKTSAAVASTSSDTSSYQNIPSILAMDEQRFAELRSKLFTVELASSVILVALNCLPPGLHASPVFRNAFKEQIMIILSSPDSSEDMEKLMPNVEAQSISCVSKALEENGQEPMTAEASQLMSSQILDLRHSENRVRQIINSRLSEFLRQVISNEVARPTQIPSGLSLFKTEIAGIAGRFARLVSHNRAIFAQHYADLIQNHCSADE